MNLFIKTFPLSSPMTNSVEQEVSPIKKLPQKPTRKSSASMEPGVIYARFSSHSQREESIEQQVKQCRAYASELGIPIKEIFDDHAVSGRSDSRPKFQKMMKAAERGEFRYVIAWKSNRMGRNMLQAMVNEARLNELGIRCLYVEEDFDDTAAGRFALRNMMNVNQFYSENMAEDITRGLRDSAEKCMVTGALPLGFRKGDDGRYAIDEPNAEIVREIFCRVASGELFQEIARDLNDRGIKTSSGGLWNKGSFHRMLRNQKYVGVYTFKDMEIPHGVPQIIDDDLWYRVQEVIKVKQVSRGHGLRGGAQDYLLTGKLRCGHCGSMMTGISGTSKSGELHNYYVCKGKREKTCDKKNVRRDTIENAVAKSLADNIFTDKVIQWMARSIVDYYKRPESKAEISLLKEELASTESSISNLLKALEMGIFSESTGNRLRELETAKKDLNRQIHAVSANQVEVKFDDVVSYLSLFKNKDVSDKKFQKTLFDSFLVAVYVYDDRLKIVFSYTGNNNTVDVPITFEEVSSLENNADIECSSALPSAPPRRRKLHIACDGAFLLREPLALLVGKELIAMDKIKTP